MPPLLDSTPVVGTEGGQAGRCCWPGQSPWTGVVWSRILLLIEVCLMVMIVPGLCLLNVSISSLVWSEQWLGFEDSGITVASLWNEFVRLSVRRLCYPPLDFHEKSWPNKHLAPKFAIFLLSVDLCIAFVVSGLQCTSTYLIPGIAWKRGRPRW